MKIDILGTEYTIITDEILDNADGSCDKTTKEIRICKTLFEDPKPGQVKDMKVHADKVFRHECIHALMFECGLMENYENHNETNVDWIACMYPKMKKIFEELNV